MFTKIRTYLKVVLAGRVLVVGFIAILAFIATTGFVGMQTDQIIAPRL